MPTTFGAGKRSAAVATNVLLPLMPFFFRGPHPGSQLCRHGLQCYIITVLPLCQHPCPTYAQVGPAWHNSRRIPHKIALRLHQLFRPVTHVHPSRRILPCAVPYFPCCKPGACHSLLLSAYGARGRNTAANAFILHVTHGPEAYAGNRSTLVVQTDCRHLQANGASSGCGAFSRISHSTWEHFCSHHCRHT